MRVKATKAGFFGGVRVPVGAELEVTEEQVGLWMEVVEESPKPKAEPKAKKSKAEPKENGGE